MIKLKSRYLAGAIGAALLASATAYTSSWEGRRLTAYQDSGGVWTICDGHTKGVTKGMRADNATCDRLLREDLIIHEKQLLACAPELATVPAETYVAINDWAFNVGTGAACKSTLVRLVKSGDLRGACDQLSRWTRVNGQVVRGLQARRYIGDATRMSERDLCLQGLQRRK